MQDDKVDLKDVNKVKKQFALPKISNPLSRQSGPNRDQEGKFATGSGGLLSGKKFNFRRALPLVAVIALVGGLFVFKSFAATATYPYQYSIGACSKGANAAHCRKI